MRYGIALGSNVGDRLAHLRAARSALLQLHEGATGEAYFSGIFQTEAVDCQDDAPDFYNAAGIIESSCKPRELLTRLQRIEADRGRSAVAERPRNAPRPLDLDIVFAGDLHIDEADLQVPHPCFHQRRFVLVPLAELCADAILVGHGASIGEILAGLPADGEPDPVPVPTSSDWWPLKLPMNLEELANWSKRDAHREPLLSLTAYDYPTARILDEAGVDLILVGDSLGMVFAGLPDTTGVTIDHMVYHTEVVRRGVNSALLAADLPFHSYDDIASTLENARRLIDAGADLVKLEGGSGQKHKIAALSEAGIPTVGHLGMLPQRVLEEGGYKKKGKSEDGAQRLLQGARDIEGAGVSAIVLESIVADVAKTITEELSVPTIGIGSGNDCDGQIRVINDLVGSYPWFVPPFATTYADIAGDLHRAVASFRDEISRH